MSENMEVKETAVEETGVSENKAKDQETGIIRIADDVVSSIAGLAVTEVEGVSKLANVPNELVAKLGRKNLSKSVGITFNDDETLNVEVKIEVRYGFNIVKVSKDVQDKVKQSLFTMTGLEVKTVNVHVTGIDYSEE